MQVLERALGPVPSARFASLVALERASCAVSAAVGARWSRARRCHWPPLRATSATWGSLRRYGAAVQTAAEVAGAWKPGHPRSRGADSARTRGEAARLDGELGAFADRWAGAYGAACLANAHGELTAPIATLQQALLQIESLDRPRTSARSDPA